MKAFVTGGSGFIGRHLVQQLIARGYDVVALARSPAAVADLAELGATPVAGDILDRESMREGMLGSDVVFHVAGWYKIGAPDWPQAEAINVAGSRNVLELAAELGVPRIVYTSTAAVYGNTKGQLVDENYFQAGPFASEYDRTKWLAHYQVAVPLIERGAPIIIVLPGSAYGPDNYAANNLLMRLFYEGRLPILPAPDFSLTYAHVEDIAKGHILAAEKGRPGESYILAGPAIPMGEMVDFWAQITGKPAPLVRVPAALLKPLAPIADALGRLLPFGEVISGEMIRVVQGGYNARADKARAELGWRPRSLHQGMQEVFAWIARTPRRPAAAPAEPQRQLAALALLTAALLLALYLFGRRRQ
ncbi:MAG: NAD-dependent epimerase/dehydratase family protein [Candidatus Promineifilaceae bacterium]